MDLSLLKNHLRMIPTIVFLPFWVYRLKDLDKYTNKIVYYTLYAGEEVVPWVKWLFNNKSGRPKLVGTPASHRSNPKQETNGRGEYYTMVSLRYGREWLDSKIKAVYTHTTRVILLVWQVTNSGVLNSRCQYTRTGSVFISSLRRSESMQLLFAVLLLYCIICLLIGVIENRKRKLVPSLYSIWLLFLQNG